MSGAFATPVNPQENGSACVGSAVSVGFDAEDPDDGVENLSGAASVSLGGGTPSLTRNGGSFRGSFDTSNIDMGERSSVTVTVTFTVTDGEASVSGSDDVTVSRCFN